MARSAVGSVYGRVLFVTHGVLATWLPDRAIRVGDIVSRSPRTGILNVETTVGELLDGFDPTRIITDGPKVLTLQRGATVDYTASGAARPVAAAKVTFASKQSFIFAGREGNSERYQQLDPVRAAMLELASRGVWRDEWQLVTGVRRFATCTIVISRQHGTTAELSVDATTAMAGTDLLAAATGVSITSGDASTWELGPARPFYEALEVSRNFWTAQPAVRDGTFTGDDRGARDEFVVVQVRPTELGLP